MLDATGLQCQSAHFCMLQDQEQQCQPDWMCLLEDLLSVCYHHWPCSEVSTNLGDIRTVSERTRRQVARTNNIKHTACMLLSSTLCAFVNMICSNSPGQFQSLLINFSLTSIRPGDFGICYW